MLEAQYCLRLDHAECEDMHGIMIGHKRISNKTEDTLCSRVV